MIYPWNNIYEEILTLLENNDILKVNEILYLKYGQVYKNETDHILRLIINNNSFYKNISSYKQPDVLNIKNYIEENITEQMTLCITNQCNMRCKYCIYSDNYEMTKNWNNEYMSKDIALHAVNYFINIIKKRIQKSFSKTFTIGFYGGEPLLNMELIYKVVNLVKSNKDISPYIQFTITTNGLLLNEDNIKYIANNKFLLILSLDGPKDEHDRLRVGSNNNGTYDALIEKINYIRENYPNYFNSYVGLSSVYDIYSNLDMIESYFSSLSIKKQLPSNFRVSAVSGVSTDYYNQFKASDFKKHENQILRLKEKYIQNIRNKKLSSSYLENIIGMSLISIYARRRKQDKTIELLPPSGACIPGKKLYVECNGNIQICEKVNCQQPIGNVWKGLDENMITDILHKYKLLVYEKCKICPISNLCQLCYMHFEEKDGFVIEEKRMEICNKYIDSVTKDLEFYSSILEIDDKPLFLEKTGKPNII